MLKDKLFKKAEDLMIQMKHITDDLEKARDAEVTASFAADKAREELLTTHRELTLEISVNPDIAGSIDPRTGKANKEWAQFLLDEKLERDSRYIKAAAKVYEKQETLARLRSHVVQSVEILNVAKTEARLVSAMLGALGNE